MGVHYQTRDASYDIYIIDMMHLTVENDQVLFSYHCNDSTKNIKNIKELIDNRREIWGKLDWKGEVDEKEYKECVYQFVYLPE